jgi:hypothetical protein
MIVVIRLISTRMADSPALSTARLAAPGRGDYDPFPAFRRQESAPEPASAANGRGSTAASGPGRRTHTTRSTELRGERAGQEGLPL